MLTPGFPVFLALLRLATGISLFTSGLQKLSWYRHPPLQQTFAQWSLHPANAAVAHYLSFVSLHPGLFSRLVVTGELSIGALLTLGLLTPLASLLGFFMVASFQFAGSFMFSMNYLAGQSGLAYLLIYPVLFFGRAGTALGLDGAIARGGRKSPSPA